MINCSTCYHLKENPRKAFPGELGPQREYIGYCTFVPNWKEVKVNHYCGQHTEKKISNDAASKIETQEAIYCHHVPNTITENWGGAGPDCRNVRVAPAI